MTARLLQPDEVLAPMPLVSLGSIPGVAGRILWFNVLSPVHSLPEQLTSFPMSITIRSLAELRQYEEQELGISDYHTISQEQINQFAAATLDFQWIHLDAERAQTESPFGATIAHGYLTLSLLPYLWNQIVSIENLKMQVNYEIESLRFNQAVTVGSQVRLRARLLSVKDLRGIAKARIEVTLEIEGSRKPAYTGVITFLYHFS